VPVSGGGRCVAINSVAFSPERRVALSGGFDKDLMGLTERPVDNDYPTERRARVLLLLDQHPAQVPEIAVIEKPADHVRWDLLGAERVELVPGQEPAHDRRRPAKF
jgi:hypothetical protein